MSYNKLKITVIEDEPHTRQGMIDLLQKLQDVEVISEAESVDEAFHTILQTKPDGLFLDIKLIGGDAFALIRRLVNADYPVPPTVLVTGYDGDDKYAVSALNDYGKYVVKYLKKPLEEDFQKRLREAIDSIWAKKNQSLNYLPKKTNIFFLSEGKHKRVEFEDLLYIESAGSGASFLITTEHSRGIKTQLGLSKIIEHLSHEFAQINRTNIINLRKIDSVDKVERIVYLIGNLRLSIGEVYYDDLLTKWKRL